MTAKTDREKRVEEKIRCDACPVMCYIANGKSGACDRYANEGGQLIRLDPLMVMQRGLMMVVNWCHFSMAVTSGMVI